MTDATLPVPRLDFRKFTNSPHLIAIGLTALAILVGSIALPSGSALAVFLFDHSHKSFFAPIYPFTIQNLMYVMLAIGFAELWTRRSATRREQGYLAQKLLPESLTQK
jgi:hypothetical protein